jgi:Na+-driven multidrug efflux pump
MGIIPGMFFHSQYDCTRQYLNAIDKAQAVMGTMMITTPLHLLWCYLSINYFKLELAGVIIATIMTYFSNFALITLYCVLNKD